MSKPIEERGVLELDRGGAAISSDVSTRAGADGKPCRQLNGPGLYDAASGSSASTMRGANGEPAIELGGLYR